MVYLKEGKTNKEIREMIPCFLYSAYQTAGNSWIIISQRYAMYAAGMGVIRFSWNTCFSACFSFLFSNGTKPIL